MSNKHFVPNFYIVYDFKAGDDFIPNCLNHDTTKILFENHGIINHNVMDYYFKNYTQIPVLLENLNVHWDIFEKTTMFEYSKLKHNPDNVFVYTVEPFANLDHVLGVPEQSYNKKPYVEYMSNSALDELKNPTNNFYLLINFANEGTLNGHTLDYIYNICERYHIPYKKIIFVIACADLEEIHEEYCQEKNIPKNKRIGVQYWTWSIREKVDEAIDILGDNHGRRVNLLTGEKSSIAQYDDLDSSKIRSKRFLNFNRRMRDHRVLLLTLFGKDFVKNNYISYDFDHCHDETQLEFFKERIPEEYWEYGLNNMKELKADFPKSIIDFDNVFGTVGFGCEDKRPFVDSYIHILSETNFSDPGVYFSEKTWKPIINLQPFISVNYYHSLHYLKEMGFKTFAPFIDEKYDTIKDPRIRMKAIYEEIKRLEALPIQELHDWYYSIVDDLKHNRELLLQYNGDFMRNVEKEYILSIKNYIHLNNIKAI